MFYTCNYWRIVHHILLPNDALFELVLDDKVRSTLKFPHVSHEAWLKETEELCRFSKAGDVNGVTLTLNRIKQLCATKTANILSSVLPLAICHDIGVKAGGTQGAALRAMFISIHHPRVLDVLLKDGDIDNTYFVGQSRSEL
jgi:hypothetical protein